MKYTTSLFDWSGKSSVKGLNFENEQQQKIVFFFNSRPEKKLYVFMKLRYNDLKGFPIGT